MVLAQSDGDQPPSPTPQLEAEAYGPTLGEIRWQRASDDRLVVGYDVTRDGETVGRFDALSYVDFDLSPGTDYRFGVTAIDTAGQTSETVFVTLSTPDSPGLGVGVPSAPQRLSATRYSGTAGELFWARTGVFGFRYEIRRDGEIVSELDGSSYFDDTLEPGREYTYSVTAIEIGQRRSSPSEVVMMTMGDAGDTRGPAPPTGLRGEVYSPSAAELFWDRSDAFNQRYSITRDGELLDLIFGTSYFDPTLEPGQTYIYEVATVDLDARESGTVEISLTTPDTGGTGGMDGGSADGMDDPMDGDTGSNASADILSLDNHVELLSYIFRIYTGKELGREFLTLPGYSDPAFVDDTATSAAETASVVCSNGGTAVFIPFIQGERQVTRGWTYRFDDCQDNAQIFDGEFERRNRGNLNVSSSGLTIESQEGSRRITGGVGYKPFSDRDGAPTRSYGVGDLTYTDNTDTTPLNLENARFSHDVILIGGVTSIDGGFTISSSATGGQTLEVRFLEPLAYDIRDSDMQIDRNEPYNYDRYQSGVLEVVAPDGRQLRLDANTGDETTVRVDISFDGETETITQPWSVWQDALTFSFDLLPEAR